MNKIVENAISRNVEESFKKLLDPDPDFQNLISFSWSTYMVKFLSVLREVGNRQTHRRTN